MLSDVVAPYLEEDGAKTITKIIIFPPSNSSPLLIKMVSARVVVFYAAVLLVVALYTVWCDWEGFEYCFRMGN